MLLVTMIAILFVFISIVALSDNAPYGRSQIVAIYAFTVASSAALFGVTKHVYAAAYFALAPLATLCFFFLHGFPPNLAPPP